MEMEYIFNENGFVGLIFFCLREPDEDVNAISSVDLEVRETRQVGFAIYVDAKGVVFL